ncbi:MAG: glycosyltransferase, partial [Myxococcota bacterium]|nr:glycosyltransferase [Myxococcota bacterium]
PENDPSPWEHRFLPWMDLRNPGRGLARARLLPRALWSRRAARTCATLIADTRPDIAHLQHIHRYITPSVLGPLRDAGVPIVWTLHDYELICPQGHLFSGGGPCEACRGHRYSEAIRRRCKWGALAPSAVAAAEKYLHQILDVWDCVDRFLCPSRFLADMVVRFGIPPERVAHRPNFLETSPVPVRGARTGRPTWVYAGRLAPEKGVDIAITAAQGLPGADLLICGRGPEEARLRRRARGLQNVRFLGHLPRRDLARHLAAARAVVVPSRWYENFPYAVLEAQAAGCAVVASRIGGIPEQIDDGVDGLLVPPDNAAALRGALGRLLDAPALARKLGMAGAQRVRQQLSPDDHLQAVLREYDTARRRRAHI